MATGGVGVVPFPKATSHDCSCLCLVVGCTTTYASAAHAAPMQCIDLLSSTAFDTRSASCPRAVFRTCFLLFFVCGKNRDLQSPSIPLQPPSVTLQPPSIPLQPPFSSNPRQLLSNRRWLPSNRRRFPFHPRQFPSNRRRFPSNRRRLPFRRRPIAYLNTERRTARSAFFWIVPKQRPASASCPPGQGFA